MLCEERGSVVTGSDAPVVHQNVQPQLLLPGVGDAWATVALWMSASGRGEGRKPGWLTVTGGQGGSRRSHHGRAAWEGGDTSVPAPPPAQTRPVR